MYSLTMFIEIGFLSFIICFLTSILFYYFGTHLNIVDIPSARSSHSTPIPRGAGLGILFAFILTAVYLSKINVFVVSASVVSIFSLVDDRYNILAEVKLLIHLLVSLTVVYFTFGINQSISGIILFTFGVIFIVGTANFFNFMDGINGIAGLSGIVGFGLITFFTVFINKQGEIALLSFSISVACLGFLPFNFPKAKVFMGDVGSVFLGFVFAYFVLELSTTFNIFFCLIMFMSTFYADTMISIYYRWRRKENLLKAHRMHLYQYLCNDLGLSHWVVSIIYAIFQFAIGVLSIYAYKTNLKTQIVLFVFWGLFFIICYKFLKSIKRKMSSI